jgi:enoyl-CoA hydratase/carnithine racemase
MGHIRYEVRDRVPTVTIDRPEKRNAMTFAILAELSGPGPGRSSPAPSP